MPPAIRIVLLVVLAAALPRLSLVELGALCGILMLSAAILRRNIAAPLWRLCWLLAVILVLAWGFTPGDPLWPALPGLTLDGLLQGARQAGVLATLVMAVHLLLAPVAPHETARGLCVLLRPLSAIGFDSERFARRLGGALHELAGAEQRLRTICSEGSLIAGAAQALSRIERDAELGSDPNLPGSPPSQKLGSDPNFSA